MSEPTRQEAGHEFTAQDYAYVPDVTNPQTWALRTSDTPGHPAEALLLSVVHDLTKAEVAGFDLGLPRSDFRLVKQRLLSLFHQLTTAAEIPDLVKWDVPAEGLRFEAGATLVKAYEDEAGNPFVTIIAADSGPDLQKDATGRKRWVAERMSPGAFLKARTAASAGDIELVDGHQGGLALGKSVGVDAEAERLHKEKHGYDAFAPTFAIETEYTPAMDFFRMAKSGKLSDRQFSVGGKITSDQTRFDKEVGGQVRWILSANVDHVAACRPGAAANPRTGVADALYKALEEGEALVTDPLANDYPVNAFGGYPATPRDNPELYVGYVGATDFLMNLTAVHTKQVLPILQEVFKQTCSRITNDETLSLEEKRAAMLKAVDDLHNEMAQTVRLAKTTEDLDEHVEGGSPAPKEEARMSTVAQRSMLTKSGASADKVAALTDAEVEELFKAETAEDFEKRFGILTGAESPTITATRAASVAEESLGADLGRVSKGLEDAVAAMQAQTAAIGSLLTKTETPPATPPAAATPPADPAAVTSPVEPGTLAPAPDLEKAVREEVRQAMQDLRKQLNGAVAAQGLQALPDEFVAGATPRENVINALRSGLAPAQALGEALAGSKATGGTLPASGGAE